MRYTEAKIVDTLFKLNKYTFDYEGSKYEFRFYQANFNQLAAPDILRDHIENSISPSDVEQTQLFMEFYWKLRNSPELRTKLSKRIIRRGTRKFDIRTFGTSYKVDDTGSKFIEHPTFSRHIYHPVSMSEGWDRCKYYIKWIDLEEKIWDIKLTEGERFKSNIYYPVLDDSEINQTEFDDYAGRIYQKLLDLKEIENRFWEGKTDEEIKEMRKGGGKESIKTLQQEFVETFSEDIDNPLFKRLFYDLEALFMSFWEEIFDRVYRFIYEALLPVERKAFLLSYMRQEYLEYQIPMFEPILEEFIRYIGKTSLKELLYCLLFSDSELLIQNNKQKFADFLKIYALWIDVMRHDETLSKRDYYETIYPKHVYPSYPTTSSEEDLSDKFHPLEEMNIDSKGRVLGTYEDTLFEEENDSNIDWVKIHDAVENLPSNQKEAIDLYYSTEEKLTQAQIGEILGISQEAVNQRLETAYSTIKNNYKPTL